MTLPFENDTTEIIRKIVSAQLKHDKLKKYLSIFAISLATFLMTAVLLLVSGIIEVNTNGGNSITGSYRRESNRLKSLWKELLIESLILAQDERWRHA